MSSELRWIEFLPGFASSGENFRQDETEILALYVFFNSVLSDLSFEAVCIVCNLFFANSVYFFSDLRVVMHKSCLSLARPSYREACYVQSMSNRKRHPGEQTKITRLITRHCPVQLFAAAFNAKFAWQKKNKIFHHTDTSRLRTNLQAASTYDNKHKCPPIIININRKVRQKKLCIASFSSE